MYNLSQHSLQISNLYLSISHHLINICRFADNPNYYDGINDRMKNTKDVNFHVRSVTKNFQSADFGLSRQAMDDPDKVNFLLDLNELHVVCRF